ncbi:sensor histidine kinase [Peptostreptococcus equinus]|uniref:histidine kinase n=1 Tax=Peptostreptococcus equinus TaxID=3003601 RepID=A0ABY7JUF2_9FIRM|nr:HAMP domain-containing sensor histidine kinase [Peptostreptococcus sp. CBA3647]WAW15788.1 HAMP domain-containing sensor histidine kinase [Peptostreptococcus sp. CBA3647]
MKRLITKWNNLNLKFKLFTTTSILAISLAIVIFSVVYILLPTLYARERITNLDSVVTSLSYDLNGRSLVEAKVRLESLTSNNIMYAKLVADDGNIVYERNKFLINMHNYEEVNLSKENLSKTKKLYLNDAKEYTLYITSVYYPLRDTSDAIRGLFPIILAIVIALSFIGSYIYSELITRPLVAIIEKEKHQLSRKKEFIGAISHELKTPITVISGQLEGMMYGVGKFKNRDYYIKKCYDDAQDLSYLVEQMLEISKKELFEDNSDLSELNINELVEKVIAKHRFLYERKEQKVKIHIKNSSTIYANKQDIITVLSNVISNAIKYSPRYENIFINLYEYKKTLTGHMIKLTIENTGVVLTKEQLLKIFDPLYRVETSRNRKTGGSGIGLYFVSNILTKYNFKYKMYCGENSTIFSVDFEAYNK